MCGRSAHLAPGRRLACLVSSGRPRVAPEQAREPVMLWPRQRHVAGELAQQVILGGASWSITWSATWIGAPVAAASASVYPMWAVICRGPAVPAAVNSIRAGAGGQRRQCAVLRRDGFGGFGMGTAVILAEQAVAFRSVQPHREGPAAGVVGQHDEEGEDPESVPAQPAFARPGFHMRYPHRCHDRTTRRAVKKCADSLNPRTFKRRSSVSLLVSAYCTWRIRRPSAGRTVELVDAARLWDPEPGWLNTASYGLPPRPAWDALLTALADWRGGRTSWEPWDESTGQARAAFARMTGATPGDIAVGATVSGLLAPVAATLPAGAQVVVQRSSSPRTCSRGWCTPTAASPSTPSRWRSWRTRWARTPRRLPVGNRSDRPGVLGAALTNEARIADVE